MYALQGAPRPPVQASQATQGGVRGRVSKSTSSSSRMYIEQEDEEGGDVDEYSAKDDHNAFAIEGGDTLPNGSTLVGSFIDEDSEYSSDSEADEPQQPIERDRANIPLPPWAVKSSVAENVQSLLNKPKASHAVKGEGDNVAPTEAYRRLQERLLDTDSDDDEEEAPPLWAGQKAP
jgi:hypothetical protein